MPPYKTTSGEEVVIKFLSQLIVPLVSLTIVLLDQLSKLFVKGFSIPFFNFEHKGMYIGQKIPLVGDFINITFVENPGIGFGIDPGINFKLLLSLVTIAACIGLIIYLLLIKDKPLIMRLSFAVLLGGAFGNLIDRVFYGVFFGYSPLFYGNVVDFLDFSFFNLMLFNRSIGNYIFNIADVAITAGIILLLIVYRKPKESTEQEPVVIEQ